MARFTYSISRTLYVEVTVVYKFLIREGVAREKCRLDDENKSVRFPVKYYYDLL